MGRRENVIVKQGCLEKPQNVIKPSEFMGRAFPVEGTGSIGGFQEHPGGHCGCSQVNECNRR